MAEKNKPRKNSPSPKEEQPGRGENSVSAALQLIKQEYSGPLPHPEILRAYESISEGFADRIIRMAEKEADHRHEMERKMLEADIEVSRQSLAHSAREIRTGQILGFLIGAICIVSGSVTAIMGHPVSGTFFGASGVCGLVTAFIYGRKGADKDRQAAPGGKKLPSAPPGDKA